MAGIKSLVKDTAIYGVSSIVGRFLNWLLVPLYTFKLIEAEYGIVTNIYAYVALTLVVLTYGMETGYFRFVNNEDRTKPLTVYSTALISLGISSSLFIALVLIFLSPLSAALDCAAHPAYPAMMAITVAVDAFTSIPFARLRHEGKAAKFAILKCVNIGINIGLNLIFFLVIYQPEIGVGYIFFANMIASLALLPLLWNELHGFKWHFDGALLRSMLRYSWPLLVLGIAGVMNQNLDKILYLEIANGNAQADLGIYGACCKVALVMMMFTQAFRYAFEPFIFAQNRTRGADKMESYRDATKYFVIFCMAIFLGVMFYMPILQYIIAPGYRQGLQVVPIVMIADVCFGVAFNLSLWYKLTDRTIWGTRLSLMGLVVTIVLNLLLVPNIGYMGCAWASLACYGLMMIASYALGQYYYPIDYPIKRIAAYFTAAMLLWLLGEMATFDSDWLTVAVRTPLLLMYLLAVIKFEKLRL